MIVTIRIIRHEKVFNDILGFRAFCDSYDQILEEEFSPFRIADMAKGKAVDDGYRVSMCTIRKVEDITP